MRRALVLLLAALAACDKPAPETSTPASSTGEPSQSVGEVTWPSASEVSTKALAKLSPEAQRVVARSPVPALVVDEDGMAGAATLMAKQEWYAMSTRGEGVTVSLHATKRAHRYPHIAPAEPTGKWQVRGRNARVMENERIWSVAWEEGGVAYSLEVECARLPDPRCEDDTYVMQLARQLAFVGGAGVKK
jgi:hypothetical protein